MIPIKCVKMSKKHFTTINFDSYNTCFRTFSGPMIMKVIRFSLSPIRFGEKCLIFLPKFID